jgi:site-specific recombinase XerD
MDQQLGMTVASQSRIISGLRSFYTYCLIEQVVTKTRQPGDPQAKDITADTQL